MDETTRLYRAASNYAQVFTSDAKIFAGAMFCIMRDRIWETGWIDQVHGTLVKAPSLTAFIEQRIPKGIGQSVEWTYAALKILKDFGDPDAGTAITLLNDQIKVEKGVTAEDLYRRKVRD
jgi:hypothetical protein